MEDATILHMDLDAFYASVEQLRDPSLRGKPIAVGGGVVLAASYEAKKYGVTSGMPGRRARQLCPGLIFVDGSFHDYLDLSDEVFAICEDFTPHVEKISIDEAFLDVAGAVHLFGPPPDIAAAIRRRVRDEVGLPISAGVARTKFLAKVASQVAKPDGMVVVDPATELEFLHPLPVELIWGVGPVTKRKLAELGVSTVGELAELPRSPLHHLLGTAVGDHLHDLSWNRDPRPVATGRRAKSVGAQSAMGRRKAEPAVINPVLLNLCDRIGTRLRRNDRSGRTVTVRVRFDDMEAVTRSHTLPAAISSSTSIYGIARLLVDDAIATASNGRDLSLIGVSVSNLKTGASLQLEFPVEEADDEVSELDHPGSEEGRRRHDLDRAVDAVRTRFGKQAVGVAAVMLDRTRRSVPDEFRELAERS